MSLHELLRRYHAAWRRRLALETAYPLLPEVSALWSLLPAGRPARLGRDARYVLFVYRAVEAETEALREWLAAREAALWAAAVEAEAALAWQTEHARLRGPWAPSIAEFAPHRERAVA